MLGQIPLVRRLLAVLVRRPSLSAQQWMTSSARTPSEPGDLAEAATITLQMSYLLLKTLRLASVGTTGGED